MCSIAGTTSSRSVSPELCAPPSSPSSFLSLSLSPQLWMMPAFGIHPEFENGLEKDFYGYRTWFTIVNFGLPLGVFYRMHSVGGLVEVYLGA